MSNKNSKVILLFSVLLMAFIIMPLSFADANQTAVPDGNSSGTLSADYYYDAAGDVNGTGTADSPYSAINSTTVSDNSVLHIAKGEYDASDYLYVANVTFSGENSSDTVIRNLNIDVQESSWLILKDITLIDSYIYSNGNLTLENVIVTSGYVNSDGNAHISNASFDSGGLYTYSTLNADNVEFNSADIRMEDYSTLNNISFASSNVYSNSYLQAFDVKFDSSLLSLNGRYANIKKGSFKNSYGNYGGAIEISCENTDITDTTFENNYAIRGGAIHIGGGVLNITDSIFKNNNASQWGGAISAENAVITLTGSKFISNHALSDAGGSIYIKNSNMTACDLNITDSSATFGGAMACVVSNVNLTGFYAGKNSAKYDGGALYIYKNDTFIFQSVLDENTARNGGALFIDAASTFYQNSNEFSNNRAENYAGAVYSIINKQSTQTDVTFMSNVAKYFSDLYESDELALEVIDSNYTFISVDYEDGELPDSYISPYSTSVKNQGSGGNCWAFAASATLESAIKKATGVEYDLSEGNMKNIMSMYSDYGWQMETNVGGYDDMGYGYLAGWLGPILEQDDEYNANNILSPLSDPLFHVQNILFIQRSNQTDTRAIKEAVYKYGAVGTCIYWSGSYNKNGNYYYDGTSGVNHAVTIVGWDDNYSRDNFKNKPEGDGAWYIKNSWGTGSGKSGYYYVSYYDTRIAYHTKNEATFAFVLDDAMKLDKNYQYDIPGRTDFFLDDGDEVWYKNIFTSTADEYLAAVSTYFEYATDWTVSVYVNGALKLTQSGSSPASYSTIKLNDLIGLKSGDTFEIVFKVAGRDGVTSFPISEYVSLNYEFYRPGISYFSKDGNTWTDLYEYAHEYTSHTYKSQVACIKAFTVFDEIMTSVSVNVTFNSPNTVDLTAQAKDQYGNVIMTGDILFSIDGANLTSSIVGGFAKITREIQNSNQDTVRVSFQRPGYVSSQNQTKFNLTKIVSYDVEAYYGDVIYTAILKDAFDRPVGGKRIIFTLNGKTYESLSDASGQATFETSLPIGEYPVSVAFEGDDIYMKCEAVNTIRTISTINMSAQTQFTYNAKYSAFLLDLNGDVLANAEVTVSLGGADYKTVTDSNGKLSLTITQKPGTYVVSITNPNTSESLNQSIKVVKRIAENKGFTMYYRSGAKYTVRAFDDAGKVAKGVKVTFTVRGKTYVRTTDSKGYASLTINLNPGTYTIKATYKGYSVSNKIAVKSTIVTKNINVKKGKTIRFYAKLLNTKGKILKYKKITFKFKGKTYKVKTNSKGIATLKITKKYKVGKYTVTSSYGSLKISNKITIKK